MNPVLQIKNSTNESVDFYIYGDIVSNSDWKWDESDTMPKDIQDLLTEHEGKNINLYVNSGGGSVMAGLGIYNQLKRASEKGSFITAHVDGLAGSIASVIIFAADKIIAPANSYIMIHNAWMYTMGNASQLRKAAEDLDRIDEGILNTYKENLKDGMDIETIKQMMNDETWMTGEQASQYFNIEIGNTIEAVACASDFYKNYKFIPSKLLKNEEQDLPLEDVPKVDENPKIESQTEKTEENQNEIEDLLFELDIL